MDEIFVTQDGSHTIATSRFGVTYHSKYGAITESRHVFIQAGLQPLLLNPPKTIHILEIGLGTGLNALLSFQEILNRPIKVYYEAIEGFPLESHLAQQLNYPAQIDGKEQALLEVVQQKIHSSAWEKPVQLNEDFTLCKRLGEFEQLQYEPHFHLIYFDAFAPTTQPELWEPPLLQKMYDALLPEGVLVTYCAKGEFKRNLKKVGFAVEALPGPPGKREMTKAIKKRA
jgi:tRNA U34 5-methylaminomethyl-2-thiouridine-forming methyltransferase MnmC